LEKTSIVPGELIGLFLISNDDCFDSLNKLPSSPSKIEMEVIFVNIFWSFPSKLNLFGESSLNLSLLNLCPGLSIL